MYLSQNHRGSLELLVYLTDNEQRTSVILRGYTGLCKFYIQHLIFLWYQWKHYKNWPSSLLVIHCLLLLNLECFFCKHQK